MTCAAHLPLSHLVRFAEVELGGHEREVGRIESLITPTGLANFPPVKKKAKAPPKAPPANAPQKPPAKGLDQKKFAADWKEMEQRMEARGIQSGL